MWEPLETYNDPEMIKCHFAKPHNIGNSICIYDPQGWFSNLKASISPYIYDKQYAFKRSEILWNDKFDHYKQAVDANNYNEFEYHFKCFLSTMLIPLATFIVDPSARKLLKQAKESLVNLGAEEHCEIFHELIGCHDIKIEEALHFLDKMMEVYDYCIKVQRGDYHGINQPKRNCHYYGIRKLIDQGYYRESIYPIFDWLTVAEYRISQDAGISGWWTQNKNALYKRLKIGPDYMNEKKQLMDETVEIIESYCLK